jgi:hypothetical protein
VRPRTPTALAGSLCALALAACSVPRAYPGPPRPRETLATIAGAEAPKESGTRQRIRIDSISDDSGNPVHAGGRGPIELLPGTYRLRVHKDLPDAALTGRLPEGVPGSIAGEEEQELRVALEADWTHRVFYDWKAAAFAVLREPAALAPRQYRGIDAPAAALRCEPEGEPPVATCRFPAPPAAEACYRAVVDLAYRGGYERAELLVRGRDDARAARAAHTAGRAKLAARSPKLVADARIEVAELVRLDSAALCD